VQPYLTKSGRLVSRYTPIVLSCEMNQYGYWQVTLSAAPGYRMAWTSARVGIGRSEAISDSLVALGATTPARELDP
jgi:hypothetical protein